ncbi:CSON000745 protein [Gryllus bimaculatus]|nr:CSON000745 protein [Gryllus bimaculatus]
MDPDVNSSPSDNVSKTEMKICGVCGDRALGYNFNAVTCESCKAFFRRNALKNKEFQCPFSENCEITVVTRRFCQRCRLEKCLAIGMRKDYIMSEEDKVIKREKIEQNRAKKRPNQQCAPSKVKSENDDTSDTLEQERFLSPFEQTCGDDVPPRKVKLWHGVDSVNNSDDTERFRTVSPRASVLSQPGSHPQLADAYPSPASAGSLSSPSSPHDSASVVGSKTLEMFAENGNSQLGPVSVISNSPNTGPEIGSSVVPGVSGYANHFRDRELGAGSSRDLPLLSSLVLNHKVEDAAARLRQASAVPPPATEATSSWDNVPLKPEACWMSGNAPRETSIQNNAAEILQDIQRIPVAPNSIESILSEAIKLEFEAYSSLAKSHQNSRELNDAERAKLNELIVANKALYEPLDDDLSSLVGEDFRFKGNADHSPVLLDVINLTAIAIRRLIKTSKKINAFKNMCQEDQIALLKGGCTEMLILRSAMTYDPDNQAWKIPHSQERLNVKVDVLKEARGNIYEEHQRFLRTFDPRWRTDENIMLILSAITLFTPDRPRVVHHDVIKLEQNTYYYLLRRYLESVYPGCEARSTFLKLIQKIAELHRLNDEHVQVYLDVNPRDVEPLLIEIFDLKPH